LRLPKHVRIARENWVRMMYCVKHLMKLHPEYNDMIMPFYAKMYDMYPYNEDDPFNFENNYKIRPRTSIERHLDELANLNQKEIQEQKTTKKEFNDNLNLLLVDLGLKLPSWDKKKGKGNDKKKPM
jgi:hypothetical protein